MASMQVTYHAKDGNKICEMGGFRFADGEMVDVTVNEANAALLEEIRKNQAFTSKPAPLPPEAQPLKAEPKKIRMSTKRKQAKKTTRPAPKTKARKVEKARKTKKRRR